MPKTTRRTSKGGMKATTIRKNLFLKLYDEKNCNISETCKAVPIDRKTYYKWIKDKRFAEAVEIINETLIDYAESKLRSCIKKENIKAIIFFLKTMGKRRGYVERQEVEHSGEITTINVVSAVPRSEDKK